MYNLEELLADKEKKEERKKNSRLDFNFWLKGILISKEKYTFNIYITILALLIKQKYNNIHL